MCGPVCKRGVCLTPLPGRIGMGSICTSPSINSACHSVLEKQVILNDSLIEKDCMSGDKRPGSKAPS